MAEVQKVNIVEEAKEGKQDLFVNVLAEIRKIVPQDFSEKENKSGVTWFGPNRTRLLKVVETKKGMRIEFNVEVNKDITGMTYYTKEQAKEKHMGTCRWIYSGGDMEVVKELVKQAISGFEPKKRADSKEEKDKEEVKVETKPAETKKEDKKPEVKKQENKPKVDRKLTAEELAKLKGGKKEETPAAKAN
jgi:hypothetical protein